MILVDLNQVMISNLMAQLHSSRSNTVDEELLRHMVLNGIRSYRNKFKDKYGEIVICCDDTNNWRKKEYPYYKAHRKQNRDESVLDWPNIFDTLNVVRDELKEFFPYKHLRVHTAEADDIIGVLCHEFGVQLGSGVTANSTVYGTEAEPILVLSGDKDFIQLQQYVNVSQYDPIRKRMIKHKDAHQYLQEHIVKGDRGDGIPNCLSSDDTFVSGGRQKPMRANRLSEIIGVVQSTPLDKINGEYEWAAGYHRNRILVDLQYTPDYIREQVLEQFNVDPGGRDGLFNYFIKKRLNNLIENISEF